MSKHSFPPHKILVPTDFGPASTLAMGFACAIHEKFGTTERVMQLADAPLLVVPKY